MKFLIVLSVLVVCASAKPFFLKHPLLSGLLGGGGSSSNAGASSSSVSAPAPEPVFVPAPPPPEPIYSEPAAPAAPAANPLAGLHKIIMIPLNIKKSLLQAHQAKFNKKIQHILGAFSKFGNLGGGGSSSNAGSSSNSISGPEPPLVPVGPPPPPISYPPPPPAPTNGLSGGNVDYNALGAIESSGGSSFSNSGSQSFGSNSGLSTGGNVQTYHPQPAPNTNYHNNPIVLYLYPVDQSSSHSSAGSSSIDYQPAPIAPQPDCNHPAPQPAPFVPQPAPFVPQPAPFIPEPTPYVPEPAPFIPEPIAPQQTYGPPDYQPAQPISSGTASSSSFDFEPQVIQPVQQPPNTYLPPSYKRRF